ncbi:transposable element Tcb2 transposase [Trichonephila clavipes]|nr:transposable element Tcb2 transposase [Trichonephila clavipes]
MAWRHHNMNVTHLQHLHSETGTTVSTKTVRNRLHAIGLMLAYQYKSCFSVHPDNRRTFIWRERGTRNNPVFVHRSVKFGGGVNDSLRWNLHRWSYRSPHLFKWNTNRCH